MKKSKIWIPLSLAAGAATLVTGVVLLAESPKPSGDAAAGAAAKPAAAPATRSVAPDAVVLTVGDEKLTAKEVDDFLAELPPQAQMMAQAPGGKRRIADGIIDVKLMSHEGTKRGLDKGPRYQLMKDQVIAQFVVQEVQKSVDEAALQKYYSDHKDEFEQVRARHILISTRAPATGGGKAMSEADAKAKADAIEKRLKGGEDFAKIAKAESDDKHSGEEGGELGTFGHGQMVPEFEKAAFALKAGETSDPIKTMYGYHIIQTEERKSQPLEQVKDDLMQRLAPEKVDSFVKDLRKNNKVDINDAYFGPAGAGLPGPGSADPTGATVAQ